MNAITLNNVIPNVFADNRGLVSDIWGREVTLQRGGIYLVEAASGTGKSSLCSYVIGMRRDYAGSILFDGRDVRSFATSEWARLRQHSLSLLFQELRLFPELTAWENVQIKNHLTRFRSDAVIRQWFDVLGIGDKRDSLVGMMSFGQQQRVAMMRALVQPFDFLFVDEPVSHLDDGNAARMADLVLTEARSQGAAIVATSIGKHLPLSYEHTFSL